MSDSWNAVVVDDHLAVRRMTRRLLESAGHDVLGEAENGAEGYRKVLDLEPDVVLLDVVLPDMSGVEVARRLKSDGSSSVVILISSHEIEDLGDPVAEAGAYTFISKSDLNPETIRRLGPFPASDQS